MVHPYGLAEASLVHVSAATRIATSVLKQHAADVDCAGRFPGESISALGSAGFMGLCLPASAGGKGEGPRAFAAVVEELARECASTAMVFVMHTTATQALSASPTLAGRDALLAEISAGRHLTTLAFSEKGSRSHFWAPMSQMERRGEAWVTSASKSWVTSARSADSYVSSSQREGAGSPMESTLYLARRGSTLRVSSAFDGLGLRGNDSAPVVIEGHAIAAGDLITPQGEGATAMLQIVLPWFSVGTAAMAAGLCRAAVDATAAHLSGSSLQHTGQKLRDLPTLRARLAEMSLRTEETRSLLGFTLSSMEKPSEATPLHVLLARLSAIRAAADVTDLAMKACGGAAFSRQLPLERLFRDARAGWVMAPTADQLQDLVGRALTGLSLFGDA